MLYSGECMDRCKNDCGFYGNVDKIFDGLCSRCYKRVLTERQHRISVTSRTSKTSISSDHGDTPPAPATDKKATEVKPKDGEKKPETAAAPSDKDKKPAVEGVKEDVAEDTKQEETPKESA